MSKHRCESSGPGKRLGLWLSRFLFKAVVVFILVIATTYGWRFGFLRTAGESQQLQTEQERLKVHVQKLAGEIGERSYRNPENLRAAADYIEKFFRDLGYVLEIQTYFIEGLEFRNIIARKPAAGGPSAQTRTASLLIGAHYDTCNNPGADDNASGVAGLLELAYSLKDVPLKKSLIFAAFVNEEPPFFTTERMGSRVYTRALRESKEPIEAAVILEMIGFYSDKLFSQKYLPLIGLFYPNRANFIAVVGDFSSRKLVGGLVKAFKGESRFPMESIVAPRWVPGIYFSDHWSFWQEEIPAAMITDTAYMRNAHYHQKSDLPHTLDYARMALVLEGLRKALVRLDNEVLNGR